jgi:acyl-CoA synthetase (AMP-forming)/AMP-acid ligase II/aryl carrier-like protein
MVNHRLEDLDGVKQLLAGGDVLGISEVRKVLERFPECEVINGYGPTEGTTFSCSHRICVEDCARTSIPIGRAINKTQVYVLDEQMKPAGVGVKGEIYIGGEGVSRGYLNRLDLTAEHFMPHFRGCDANRGERLYRTGDMGRWREDGLIEFMGRKDEQVKVRGYRIEPGEIEATLRQHARVQDAVVMAREGKGEGEGKRLVAYVVGRGEAPGAGELRAYLRERLPEYMLPAVYMAMKELPLTANGKLDRQALPEPGAEAYASSRYEAPQGELETRLARIWTEVLKVEQVGRHDNFFELGGHSLLAIKLIERMRQEGLCAEVRRLFAAPTLAGLAATEAGDIRQIKVPENRIPELGKHRRHSSEVLELHL